MGSSKLHEGHSAVGSVTQRLCACLVVVLLYALATPAHAERNESPGASHTSTAANYFVEFRVATIGTYGHSYVAFGKLNGRGQPVEIRYTDHHPRGNYALMALGHVLPVPANTKWDPEVLTLSVASSFRRKITAAQYKSLLAAIHRLQVNKQPYWNVVTNNCNHYVGELARSIGMRTPTNFQVSYAFIPALRDLNERGSSQ